MKKYFLILLLGLTFSDLFSSRFTYNQINDAMKIVKMMMEKNSTASCVKNQVDLMSRLFSATTDLTTFEIALQSLVVVDELGKTHRVGDQILEFAACITPCHSLVLSADDLKPVDKTKTKESSKDKDNSKESAKDSAKEKASQKSSKNNEPFIPAKSSLTYPKSDL